jgi:hypothetical protein
MSTKTKDIIERSFAQVPRPSDEDLVESPGHEELEDTEPFRGKAWDEIGHPTLLRHQYALFWFTPEAFHYFLPAFLCAALDNPGSLYTTTILQFLSPTDDKTLATFAKERWSLLTDAQIQALDEWLSYLLLRAKPGAEGELEDAIRVVRERLWW